MLSSMRQDEPLLRSYAVVNPAGVVSLPTGPGGGAMTDRTGVVTPTTFGLALFDHAVRSAPLWGHVDADGAVLTLLRSEILERVDPPPTLPLPIGETCRAVCERILADPAAPLSAALAGAAASRRTIERGFRAELGTGPAAWQRWARCLLGLELISDGESVTAAASAVGYATASAFTHAVRSGLGEAPTAYLARSGQQRFI